MTSLSSSFMAVDFDRLEIDGEQSKMQLQPAKLYLDIPTSTNSEPPSVTSSEASPNPLAESDILSPEFNGSLLGHTRPSSSSTTHDSTCSLPASGFSSLNSSPSTSTLNVKFAPLPELAPRRRKSTTPLGMAARGQLMRRRRGQQATADQKQIQEAQQMWTPEELEEQRRRAEAMAARHAYYQATAAALEARREQMAEVEEENAEKPRRRASADDPDDPFLSLGRFMKGASKTLWKKVSIKDVAAAAAAAEKEEISAKDDKERDKDKKIDRTPRRPDSMDKRRKSDPGPPPNPHSTSSIAPPVPPLPAPLLRPILANITSNGANTSPPQPFEEFEESAEEGGVWEEEVSDTFLKNVGQTETFVEGRPVFSTSATVEVVAKSTPPSSPSQIKRISFPGKS